jgi:hypothetical protein
MISLSNGQRLGAEARRGWRAALGWSATSAPVAFLLLTGIALGPQGINLLSASVLPVLNPAVPVALAALGVLVGLGIGERRSMARHVLTAATLEAAVILTVVAIGFGTLAWTGVTVVRAAWVLAVACGISAATSLTLPTGDPLEPRSFATRLTEAGVLLPIVAGGLLLAWLHAGSPAATLLGLAQTSAVTLALTGAGWLLLTETSSITEERVFTIAALLLLGGAADALGQSALLAGLIAGVGWRFAGGRPRDTIGRDVLFVQHPFLVLVLLVAGTRAELSLLSLTLGLLYVLVRIVGVVAGSRLASRIAGMRPARPPALRPGVFGVAFALNVANVADSDASLLLTTVVVGTVGAEVAAMLLSPRSGE